MRWEPCLTRPENGIAFFDGLTIETDKITDPRQDRVLPILEEEQVYMCRRMRHLFEEQTAPLVLDVGTGSGVFAIWAAKHGARVVAVDISERALRFARKNVRENAKTTVREAKSSSALNLASPDEMSEAEDLIPGEILLANCRFGADFLSRFEENVGVQLSSFDVVTLSPPYNPTAPFVEPAEHAAADLDGQKCFEEQIKAVPNVLSEKGVCVGNQMTPARSKDDLYAIKQIKEVFGDSWSIKYDHILGDLYGGKDENEIRDFLKTQYKTYRSDRPGESNDTIEQGKGYDVDGYIEDTEEEIRRKMSAQETAPLYWALIYYEVRWSDNQDMEDVSSTSESFQLPDASWQDRVELHRQIVDHASSESTLETASYLLDQDFGIPDPDFETFAVSLTDGRELSEEELKKRWADSPMRAADHQLIQRRGLLDNRMTETPTFDFLLADTAPYFLDPKGQFALDEEVKIWSGENLPSDFDRNSFLAAWQHKIGLQHRTGTAPFFHPYFVGADLDQADHSFGESWSRMFLTTLREGTKFDRSALPEKLGKVLHRIEERIHEAQKAGSNTTNKKANDYPRWHQKAFSVVDLNSLDVPEYSVYKNKVFDRIRKDFGLGEDKDIDPRTLRDDLAGCHRSLHERSHRELIEYFGGEERWRGWSTLIGAPIVLSRYLESGSNGEPEFYRGGIWILAASSTPWTPGHERELINLWKRLWAGYSSRYNFEGVEGREKKGKEEAATISGHEAGPQLTTAERFLPAPKQEMKEHAHELIEGSLRYVHLFLNETSSHLPNNWLPWIKGARKGKKVDEWAETAVEIAWKIAVAREARDLGERSEERPDSEQMGRTIRELMNAPQEFTLDTNNLHRFSPSGADDKRFSYNLLRWFLSACSNAFKWSAPEESHEHIRASDRLKTWADKKDFFFQLGVAFESGHRLQDGEMIQDPSSGSVVLSVFNGCPRGSLPDCPDTGAGTLGVLSQVGSALNLEVVPIVSLSDEESEERLPAGQACGAVSRLQLPSEIFVHSRN